MLTEIAEFLSKGIICYSEPQVGQILSTIFLRPKSDGPGPIVLSLSLKALDDSVVYHHFQIGHSRGHSLTYYPWVLHDFTGFKRRELFHSHCHGTARFFEVCVERHPSSIFVSTYGVDVVFPNIYKGSKTRFRPFETLVRRLY